MPTVENPPWRRVYQRVRRTLTSPPEVQAPEPAHARNLTRRIWFGEYDWPGFVPRRGWRVIDVGANVGAFSLLAASRKAIVEAYEPHPETFAFLQSNVASAAVTCHQAAVVGQAPPDGHIELHLGDRDTQHSILGQEQRSTDELSESISVPAVALAATLGEGCDLLKLDCEGAEFAMIESLTSDDLRRVRRIVAELHGDQQQMGAFDDRLRSEGFRVRRMPLEHERLAMCFARR